MPAAQWKTKRVVLVTAQQHEGGDQRVPSDVEVPEVALGQVVAGGGWCGHGLAFCGPVRRAVGPDALLDHGEVVEVDLLESERTPTGADELALGPQVDHRTKAQFTQSYDVVARQFVQGVGPVQPAPPGGPPVRRRVATQVPEIEGAIERDEACVGVHQTIFAAGPMRNGSSGAVP